MKPREYGNSGSQYASIDCPQCREQIAKGERRGVSGFFQRLTMATLVPQVTTADNAWIMSRSHAKTKPMHRVYVHYFDERSPLSDTTLRRLKRIGVWPAESTKK